MPKMSVAENPQLADQMLKKAMQGEQGTGRQETPEMRAATPSTGELCGWYFQKNGQIAKEFQVRELTGRDEEHLASLASPNQFVSALLQRGLVSVGEDKADNEVIDGLLAGDWDTVLLALRIATFGAEHDQDMTCSECETPYTAKVDLAQAPRKEREPDREFEVTGRHGTVYSVGNLYGSTQRAILSKGLDLSVAKANSMIIQDCIVSINGKPVMSPGQTLDIPLMDRAQILERIAERRVGPNFDLFVVECPSCGKEDPARVSLANTFRS